MSVLFGSQPETDDLPAIDPAVRMVPPALLGWWDVEPSSWFRPTVNAVIRWLLADTTPGTGPTYPATPPEPLATYLLGLNGFLPPRVALVTRQDPLGMIVHRDLPLPYHRDRRAPVETRWNATLLAASECEGGDLMLADAGVRIPLGRGPRLVVFDGQSVHGVAPFTLGPRGYRLAVTAYLAEADPE